MTIGHRPERIAMLTHEFAPYPGGVARYCLELARAAVRAGHQVTIFAPDHGSVAPPAGIDGIELVRFPGHVYGNTPTEVARLVARLAMFLARRRFDVVHAADWPMIMALGMLPGKIGQRRATIHGTDAATLHRDRRARVMGSRLTVRRFGRYLPNSVFSGHYLRSFFPAIPEERISVAPLGVGSEWFEPVDAAQHAAFGKRLADARGTIRLGTIARIEARKGHIATVRALARLPDTLRRQISYVSIGKIVDRALFEEIVAEAGTSDVDFLHLGQVADWEVKAAYANLDCFILTAQENPINVEGFGLVLLEAAAQGLPALVTPVHAIPEVVRDGVTGWITADAGPDAIADTLTRLCADLAVFRAMRGACIDQAREYSWDRCAALSYAG